jgi:hypothetical protein
MHHFLHDRRLVYRTQIAQKSTKLLLPQSLIDALH